MKERKHRDVILALKPKYWDMIPPQDKLVEFRRKWVKEGTKVDKVYIYASAPVQKIVGWIRVAPFQSTPAMVWEEYQWCAGITKEEFYKYVGDLDHMYGLYIIYIVQYTTPKEPRELFPWWNKPPQNFMYVREEV